MKPLLLHTMDLAWRPNPLKVAILLDQLEIPYSCKQWFTGTEKNGVSGPILTKLNPFGATPVLEDPNTGIIVWESGAVLNYVIRTYGEDSKLGPGKDARSIAEFEQWNEALLTGLGPIMPERLWALLSNNTAAVQHFEVKIYAFLSIVNTRLQHRKYVMGDTFTVVDINYFAWVTLMEPIAKLDLSPYPELKAWAERCEKEPGVGKAYKSIDRGVKP